MKDPPCVLFSTNVPGMLIWPFPPKQAHPSPLPGREGLYHLLILWVSTDIVYMVAGCPHSLSQKGARESLRSQSSIKSLLGGVKAGFQLLVNTHQKLPQPVSQTPGIVSAKTADHLWKVTIQNKLLNSYNSCSTATNYYELKQLCFIPPLPLMTII